MSNRPNEIPDYAARVIYLQGCLAFAIEEAGDLNCCETAHELRYAVLQLQYELVTDQRVCEASTGN